jgi:hypothetical protein
MQVVSLYFESRYLGSFWNSEWVPEYYIGIGQNELLQNLYLYTNQILLHIIYFDFCSRYNAFK